MPKFGKRTPLGRGHFTPFEEAFGKDADGLGMRKDQGDTGRFRSFSREAVKARGDSWDIGWLKDENADDTADLPEPAVLAQEVIEDLSAALIELEAILVDLGEGASS